MAPDKELIESHIRDGPFDFSWGGGAFLRVLDFFLDVTDSARLFFIESCRVHDIFLNFYYSVNTIIQYFYKTIIHVWLYSG